MAQTTFNIGEWNAYKRDMERLDNNLPDVFQKAGHMAGAKFDGIVRTELPPPVRRQKQAPYWTTKQRAWWWATMRDKALGKSKALPGWKAVYRQVNGRKTLIISGHYKRTGKLVQSLTYDVVTHADETLIRYGTNRLYAKYVIDQEDQATYHKGNWRTLNAMAADHQDEVTLTFAKVVGREIDHFLGV